MWANQEGVINSVAAKIQSQHLKETEEKPELFQITWPGNSARTGFLSVPWRHVVGEI